MDQEQEVIEQTPEQDAAEFAAGFNSVRGSDDEQSPEIKAVEPEKTEETPVPDATEVAPEETPEEPTYFGMSESQIKSLLERSARVDAIEDQLRKAHGKIGELNSTVQNLSTQQRPTPQAPVSSVGEDEMSQWEQDFPELAAMAEAKARKIASEMMSGIQANPGTPSVTKDEMIREANLAIMDANYDGWRETIGSQDFSLWIATQPADVQEAYNSTVSAKVLGGVLSSFQNWKTKANDRGIKSKARLESALIPSGNASKVVHAPTAHDEFVAGFNAVRANY